MSLFLLLSPALPTPTAPSPTFLFLRRISSRPGVRAGTLASPGRAFFSQRTEQPLTGGMSWAATMSPHRVSVTLSIGATWACVCFQALPVSLSQAELSLQLVLATLLFGVHSAWHPSFKPQRTALLTCTSWALWDSVTGEVFYVRFRITTYLN